jgi:regulation of enolase protein 1 (concanavalin A-like superfamily)
MRKLLSVSLLALLSLACGGSGPVANKPKPTPVPDPKPAEAVVVDKPVNISFSTYSREWPVGWVWVDPEEKHKPTPKDVKKGVLRVTIPTGKDLYGDNRTAPRYVKAITGDFQIETRVKFLPKENYQGAGLLIYKDGDNFMRFERAYGGLGGGGEGIRIDVRKGADQTPLVTPGDIQTEAPEVELKIVRTGRLFTAYWREDENAEWREAGEFESDYPDTILAGVIACNTAREVTAEFAYIKLLPAIKK